MSEPAQNEAGAEAVPLTQVAFIGFVATELEQFCHHIGEAAKQFATSSTLPSSIFKLGAAGKKKDKKVKRKPTAFNLYVKEKISELKDQGVTVEGDKNNNGRFTLAVAEWKKLTDDERQAFSVKHKAGEAGEAEAAGNSSPAEEEEAPKSPELASPVSQPATTEGKSKRKAKAEEKDEAEKKPKKVKTEEGKTKKSGDADVKKKKKKSKEEKNKDAEKSK